MAGKIFINYRRDDGAASAARLRDRLASMFGRSSVFMDVDNLLAGQRFDRELAKALAETDVFLAVIGPRWMELLKSRTEGDERDYVREEIAEALKRGVLVIPVLIEKATLPRRAEMPEDIRALVLHQKHDITHEHFGRDVDDLVAAIRAGRKALKTDQGWSSRTARWSLVGGFVLTIGLGGVAYYAGTPLLWLSDRTGKKKTDDVSALAHKAEDLARQAWAKVKDATSPAVLEGFVKQFGDTDFGAMARARLDELRKKQQISAPTPQPGPASALTPAASKAASKIEYTLSTGPCGQLARLRGAEDVVVDGKKMCRRPSSVGPQEQAEPSKVASSQETPSADQCDGVETQVGNERRCLKPKDSFKDCSECPEMVVVPAGEFTMGSLQDEAERSNDEGPLRKVTLAKPFAAGKFEVTFAEWDACVTAGGCQHRPADHGWGRGTRPVINVSWDDAKEYVSWLGKKTGRTYRLLSEAEWEYAARAGTTTTYSTGRTITTDQANFDGNHIYGGSAKGIYRGKTIEVGSFKPNAFGLHDMHGNAAEWVDDCYQNNYNGAPTDSSAKSGASCNSHVLRGGAWNYGPRYLRSAFRNWDLPGRRYIFSSFRLARTLD